MRAKGKMRVCGPDLGCDPIRSGGRVQKHVQTKAQGVQKDDEGAHNVDASAPRVRREEPYARCRFSIRVQLRGTCGTSIIATRSQNPGGVGGRGRIALAKRSYSSRKRSGSDSASAELGHRTAGGGVDGGVGARKIGRAHV